MMIIATKTSQIGADQARGVCPAPWVALTNVRPESPQRRLFQGLVRRAVER